MNTKLRTPYVRAHARAYTCQRTCSCCKSVGSTLCEANGLQAFVRNSKASLQVCMWRSADPHARAGLGVQAHHSSDILQRHQASTNACFSIFGIPGSGMVWHGVESTAHSFAPCWSMRALMAPFVGNAIRSIIPGLAWMHPPPPPLSPTFSP